MRSSFIQKVFLAGLLNLFTGHCSSQTVRQEGDEFLEKKVVLINTQDRPVDFKLNFTINPDLGKWPTYTIKAKEKKIYEMGDNDKCYIIIGNLKKTLRKAKTYRLYFDVKTNVWEIL